MKTTKTCPRCNAAFEGRSNQMYCSSACKQLAFQQRQRTPADKLIAITSGSTSVHTQPNQSFSPKDHSTSAVAAKATVEIEKLRLESSEKLRRLELEERERERYYEQAREERRYKQELDLAERNNKIESQKWGAERSALLNRSDGLEKKFALPPAPIPDEKSEPDHSDEDSSGTGSGLLLSIMGIAAVFALIKHTQPTKQPVSSLDEFAKKYLTKPATVPPPIKTVSN